LEALDEAMVRELTLVCTPAGFGKTTLLADWAARITRSVAWLSLDPDDSDPVRFWRYVVAALERAGVALGERVPPLLEGPGEVSSEGVVTALLNELETSADEVMLVFDDYHVIDSRLVHDGITSLVSHLPRQLHVLIASRSDPPLPLARLRARDQIAELRAADLRFTPQESAAFLRELWGLDLSPEAVGALESRTEGWAVGLQLAALSLRDHPEPEAFLDAFTGTHRYVLDYLSEEVLERQPNRVRTFLLRTSILERLCGPLCDAVTGESGGQDMLEELERANLFLVPLDEERRWYRFHHLFGDLLRARLMQSETDLVPELHRRAAEWAEQHGLIDEAIHHALGSGDGDWAARLVEAHLSEALGAHVGGELLGRWLARLPRDVVRSRPALWLAEGSRQLFLGRLDFAERLIEEVERVRYGEDDRLEFALPTPVGTIAKRPAAIALLRAQLAAARGDADRMEQYARTALTYLADEEFGPRYWARWRAGPGADLMRGRLADAEGPAGEMLAEGRSAPAPYLHMTSCYPLAEIQRGQGKLGAARRTYRESLELATAGDGSSPFHEAEAHIGIAEVLYERDQLEDALEHVRRSIERSGQETWFRQRQLIAQAWIHQALAAPEAALEAMDDALRAPPSPSDPAAERARLLLAQGRIADTEEWAEERALTPHDEVSYLRERDHLVLARVLLARSEPAKALPLLERLETLARSQARKASLIQILAIRALALEASGNRAGAFDHLIEALTLAMPERYIRVFADEGAPMGALLQGLARARTRNRRAAIPRTDRDHLDHLNRVIRAFRVPSQRAGAAARTPTLLIESLTPRELEILGSLAAGRRNREIADELVVTLDTVKRHVSHILDKLGAANRTEAVARARDLGIIH
jgi:LuxR family maltose regulon positive regulatory protein